MFNRIKVVTCTTHRVQNIVRGLDMALVVHATVNASTRQFQIEEGFRGVAMSLISTVPKCAQLCRRKFGDVGELKMVVCSRPPVEYPKRIKGHIKITCGSDKAQQVIGDRWLDEYVSEVKTGCSAKREAYKVRPRWLAAGVPSGPNSMSPVGQIAFV